MSGLLSVISGQFQKALILATFFPTLAFAVLGLVLFDPLFPGASTSLVPPLFQALDPQWRVVAFTLFTFVLSGILFYLNAPLLRWYEGYPWRTTWLGALLTSRQIARRSNLEARNVGMRTLIRALPSSDRRAAAVSGEWNRINWELSTDYPSSDLVLPTRLGNVIRSSEYYPDWQYGIDAVTVWPRLIAKIDKDYATAMDDAKIAFDFMLNCSFLSAVLGLILLVVGWLRADYLMTRGSALSWAGAVVILLVLSAVFYNWAILRARDWGKMVKGAFDLYRGQLLEQLGYKTVPATSRDERDLWFKISQQLLYGDSPAGATPSPSGPVVDYSYILPPKPAAAARGNYAVPDLQTTRTLGTPDSDGIVVVSALIQNASTYPARDVVVADTLPDGLRYCWESARVDGDSVPVAGANPYYFSIGDVPPEGHKLLTYHAVAEKKG